ncbi:MAG: Rab family GTPase [Candidatus Thorarchaeota archaeon]
MKQFAYKICIFGESNVGKTTLAVRLLKGYFEKDIKLTMGAEILVKFLEIEDKKIVLQVWDFGGQKMFDFLLPLYSRGSSGALFMFDLTREHTLDRVEGWLDSFREGLSSEEKEVPVLLVGSKLDLKEQRQVIFEEAEVIKRKYGFFEYVECSSKTGENAEYVFESLVKRIFKYYNVI